MFRRFASLVTVLSLPVFAAAPSVTTNSANSITASSAQLNATANAGGEATTGWFRHSTTSPGTCDDVFGTRVPGTLGTAVGAGTTNVAYSVTTTGLLPGITYFFCAIVQNASGTAFGNILSFTTPALAPTVFSQAATLVTSSSAQLNGSATPNGATTTGYFRYSSSNPGGSCSTFFGTRIPASSGSALGAGNSSQNYNQTITGLLPGTTYYYCAFADNSQGTSLGVPLSLTTLVAAPATTTSSAFSITSTTATLQGTINPNGAPTTGWFRVATSNPGTCNDAFGTRVPLTGGTNMGSATFASSYSLGATGLTPGTTYYFCAIGQNSEGTTFGAVQSFATPAVPVVTSDAETLLTSTTVTLNGTANPSGSSTTGYFRYSATNPGVCDDVFGTRAPSFSGTGLGAGLTGVAFLQSVGGLLPGTTYYFCAIAANGVGTSFGGIRSFTTPPAIPSVSTSSATLVTGTTLTLNGAAVPRGAVATGYFRYSTTNPGTCNDTFGTRAPASGGTNLGSSNSTQTFLENLTGLTRGTTYFFCAIASNSAGTGFGAPVSVTTPAVPTVTTSSLTSLGGTFATLNGAANPNLATATAYFRYSVTDPGTCNDTFGTRAPASSGTIVSFNQSYTQSISGLLPSTRYFYCAIATNSEGTGFGSVLSFTTPNVPTMVTNPPTSLLATSVTLNGTGTPNNSSTSGWFRYDSSNPGTCSDSFGFRVPFSGSTFLGAALVAQAYSQSISLTPGTQYWYCAIGSNGVGTSFGSVETFTAPATAPIVSTGFASLVTGTTATLNGSAVPRGAASTGYFRYSTTSPGSCNDTFGTRAPATGGTALGSSNSSIAYAEALTALLPGTTYYFCAIALNSAGTGFGSVQSFATPNVPTVFTSTASSVTGTSAFLNGSANPQGATATGYFRYGVTDPGTCNDSYGTRAPSSSGTFLGSGFSSTPFSVSLTSLSPGTTYYVCALASNSVGVGFGLPVTFSTPNSPTVTTLPATSVSATAGTLNATGIPNGSSATGWFRYATTNPGTCDDVFGTRAPLSGGNALGSGSSTTPFSVTPMALLPGTTYYFCAIASNAVGTSYGAVLSFTTPALQPLVTSASTSFISDTSATLNGSATPRGDATTAWFRYAASNPGACNDTFGTRTPSTGGTSVGAGNVAQTFTQVLTGLAPSTTYYWCAIAQNSIGTTFGSIVTFTTVALPTTITQAASPVTSTTATLNSTITPNGTSTTAWFRYSLTDPTTCNDTFGTRTPASGGTFVGSGSTPTANAASIASLLPGNTYFFCAIAQNTIGTQFGALLTFTTPPQVPGVTTGTPAILSATTGTFNGSANPNGAAATAWFRFATSNPGVCNDAFGTRVPATGGTAIPFGNSPVTYSQPVTGLSTGTTYYVCAIAQNSVGLNYGSVLTITTPGLPTAVTVSATAVTSSGALLNGTGNPNRADTTGFFRYSTTNPTTCDDVFGARAPTTGGSALGNGTSAVSYSQTLSGLAAGTTYYFCAINDNVVGKSFGAVRQFTTLNAPTMVTGTTTLVTASSATLNATGNPNNATTTGWFRYSTVNPVTCNDTFGTRQPFSGGTALGAGTTAVPFSSAVTGLFAGTTYYVCAIGSNAAGTSFGAVETFVTPGPPAVVTSPIATFGSTTATLEGTANPNLGATTGWFRYSTMFLSTCNDTFGTRAPATGGAALGSGTMPAPFSELVSGLLPATTYYVCAIASNSAGTRFGAVQTFTTTAAPAVVTSAATLVTGTSATLNGSANPRGSAGSGWFRYSATSPGTCNDTFGTRVSMAGTALGSGSTSVAYAELITGLTQGVTYYFCALASNAIGTTPGPLLSFTTPAAPTVTTSAATSVLGSTATFNGAANPNRATTTAWFRYATTSPGTCDDTFGTRFPSTSGTNLGAGSISSTYNQFVTGLSSSTTYFYCAIAQNSEGTAFGTVQTFTTLAAPTVTTQAATTVTGSSATLNGQGTPIGSAATGWFRFSTINPGTCNDTFGTRTPFSGGTSLGSGTSAVPFTANLTGLSPGTTYFFCAIASNAVGTGVGAVLTFSTPGAPSVTTVAPSGVSSSVATLNGSADPRGSDTTGYFRFSTTNPGVCNTTFGIRAPGTGGTTVLASAGVTPFSASLSGLAPSTTYYYCAIGTNSVGTTFGALTSFTTPTGPTVTSSAATNVTGTGATLNASVNPLGSATTAWFRFSAVDPGSCNDTFGTRAPVAGINVGSGSSPTAANTTLSGLTSSTTYYFCVIAQNGNGTGFSSVLTFFTPGSPTVTSTAASTVTSAAALVGGTVNPAADATTAWVRYSTTSPGACNDTFGTRFPATGGSSLGSGTTPQSFTQNLTGLTGATTYFFCAIAQNSIGTSFGAVLSFTTLAAPAVTTSAATLVTSASATLNGAGTPFGAATTGYFRFSTTNPTTCNDTFGTRAPATGGAALGSGGTSVAFTQSLSGLAPGATYYFCAIASNAVGVSFGTVLSFTTGAAPPSATTGAATMVTGLSALLNGTGTANGSASTGFFRYGTTNPGTCTDTFGTRAPATGGTSVGSGATATAFTEAIMGLLPGTTYFFCAGATSAAGTTFGSVQTLTTPRAPTVTTTTGQPTTATQATVNGTVTANGDAATAYFRYGTTNPGTCTDAFGTRFPAMGGAAVPAAAMGQAISQQLTGLTGGTQYFFCAAATNAVGTSFGTVQSFTTPGVPVVVTSSASQLNGASPRLNGTVNPTGAPTVAWFRLSKLDPGACNDTFGRRAPAAGGTTVAAGTMDTAFSEVVTGLDPGSTYFFCAIAENPLGKSFGQVLQFNSFALPPTVTTGMAADIVGTSATVNGTVNPNGTTATGWFRYAEVKPTSCDDMFGTRVPAMGGMTLGAGTTAAPYTLALSGLRPNTKYFFCAVASNMGGAAFGDLQEFQTTSAPPIAKTVSIEPQADGTVVFKGTVNPNGSASTAAFRYGASNPGTCSFGFGTRVPSVAVDVPAGFTDVPLTQVASDVRPGTYFGCLFSQNFAGDGPGEVITFTVEGAKMGCSCSTGLEGMGASGVLAIAILLWSRRKRTQR
jgi:YHS domain-containing protein